MSTKENELHSALIRHVAKRGFAPSTELLLEQLGWSEGELQGALKQLAATRGVILKPDSFDVWAIHPFTLMPTPTWVIAQTGAWWANCAWCALGVGAALRQNIQVTSRVGAERDPIEFEIRDGRSTDARLLIHFPFRPHEWWRNEYNPCGGILFFLSHSQVDDWCARHGFPRGAVIDIRTGVDLAREWFSGYLEPTWARKSADEARRVFRSLGLSNEFWCGQ